jgi:hypothetical protein
VALMALITLAVNDHVLKIHWPSPLTGILSGIAGVALLPLVLVAAGEMLTAIRRSAAPVDPNRRAVAVTIASVATGVGYAAVELLPAAETAYRHGLGVLQWPAAAVGALAGGGPLPALHQVAAVADPFDLLALGALAIPLRLARVVPRPRAYPVCRCRCGTFRFRDLMRRSVPIPSERALRGSGRC